MAWVYIIHIDPPYKGFAHYVGATNRGMQRFQAHMKGHGAQRTKRALKAGSKLSVMCWWVGVDFAFERYVKRRFKSRPHARCPWCNPNARLRDLECI